LGDKREKHPESILSEKLFRGKIFVLFYWLGLVFITLCLLFLYNFCHSPKKLASVSPFSHNRFKEFSEIVKSEIFKIPQEGAQLTIAIGQDLLLSLFRIPPKWSLDGVTHRGLG
jgi:hypothetical protein